MQQLNESRVCNSQMNVHHHTNVEHTIYHECIHSRRALATCLKSPRVCERMTRLEKATICSTHKHTVSVGFDDVPPVSVCVRGYDPPRNDYHFQHHT